MARNEETIRRFIISCFTRRGGSPLGVETIQDDTRLVFSANELENVMTVLDQMVSEGRIDFIPGKALYELNW